MRNVRFFGFYLQWFSYFSTLKSFISDGSILIFLGMKQKNFFLKKAKMEAFYAGQAEVIVVILLFQSGMDSVSGNISVFDNFYVYWDSVLNLSAMCSTWSSILSHPCTHSAEHGNCTHEEIRWRQKVHPKIRALHAYVNVNIHVNHIFLYSCIEVICKLYPGKSGMHTMQEVFLWTHEIS